MAQTSPSEFLTFYRRLTASQALKYRPVTRTCIQPFSSSTVALAESQRKNDIGGAGQQKKHVLDKSDASNVQAHESQAGRTNRVQGTGGVATEQRDPGKSATKKAKEEFPEAPTTIGFQDERGGKGL